MIVRRRFFETSVLFLLPLLLLPLISEGHYRYINLYFVLALFYIWLYIKEMQYPVLFLNNDVLSFRKFGKFSYLKGFLTYDGMANKLTKLPLKDISKIDFDYPMISVFQTNGEQLNIALKVSEEDFTLIKGELIKRQTNEQ